MVTAREDGVGLTWGDRLAGTGVRTEGLALPDWEAARALVLSACKAFLPVRTLGWDIALTPGGPVAIEANTRFGALPFAGARDLVARLEREAATR